MLGSKRGSNKKNEDKNAKRIKIDETTYLLSLKKEVENYFLTYKNIETQTFKEKLIHQSRLYILERVLQALNHEMPFDDLEKALAEIWKKFKHSIVSYTALPENEITILLCDIASMVGHKFNKPALNVLMPGVCLENISDDYPHLINVPIKDVLRTHVLSQCGYYLAPIRLLLDVTLQTSDNEKFYNPYFNYELDEKGAYIQGEVSRLFSHSMSTQALGEAKEAHNGILSTDQSLYAQLSKFCSALSFNSVDGIGSEENAGEQTYAAIIAFNDYFQKLENESIASLPENLKNEIIKILNLSSDQTLNVNATETIETCIATRRKLLFAAIQGHEDLLMEINPSQKNQKKLIIDLTNKFEQCRKQLMHELNNNYTGVDRYPITKSLMNLLGVIPSVTKEEELADLLSLSVDDLEVIFLDKPELAYEIARTLDNIEKLVMFFINTPYEKLEFVFSKIKNLLQVNNLIKSRREFVACLISLEDMEKFKLVFNFLFSDIDNNLLLIKGKGLGLLLKPFFPQQRAVIFHELRNYFEGQDLFDVVGKPTFINYLSKDDAKIVFKDMIEKSNITQDPKIILSVLPRLTPDANRLFFTLFRENISELTILQSTIALGCYLESSSVEEGLCFLQKFKNSLNKVILNTVHFKVIMDYIHPEKRKTILGGLLKYIDITKILKCHHFIIFVNSLTLDEFEYFITYSKDKLMDFSTMINIHLDLISELSEEKKMILVHKMKESFNRVGFLKKITDLSLMNYCTLDECRLFETDIKNLVKRAVYFNSLKCFLPYDKLNFVFNVMKNNIENNDLFTNPFSLGFYIEQLSLNEALSLIETTPLHWDTLLKNTSDLKLLLEPLSPEKRSLVFGEVANKVVLSSLIQTTANFDIFNDLSLKESTVFLKGIAEKWSHLIKRGKDITNILESMLDVKARSVFRFLKEHINFNEIIYDDEDLDFLNHLSKKDCRYVLKKFDWASIVNKTDIYLKLFDNEFFEDVHDEIFSMLRQHVDVTDVFRNIPDLFSLGRLSSDEFKVLISDIGDRWSQYIKKGNDIFLLLNGFSKRKHVFLLEELKKYIDFSKMFFDVSDITFINFLSWDEFDLVLKQVSDHWSNIIKTTEDFNKLLDSLSPGRRKLIFNEIKNNRHMLEMIENLDDLETILDALSPEEIDIIQSHIKIKAGPEDVNNLLFFFDCLQQENPDQDVSNHQKLKHSK